MLKWTPCRGGGLRPCVHPPHARAAAHQMPSSVEMYASTAEGWYVLHARAGSTSLAPLQAPVHHQQGHGGSGRLGRGSSWSTRQHDEGHALKAERHPGEEDR